MKFTHTLLILFFIASCIGCGEERTMKKENYNNFNDITPSDWKQLSKKKIFFGHQSVGLNIIDGIKDVMKENANIDLDIVESNKISDTCGTFAHYRIGKNREPELKIKDFVKLMEDGIAKKIDIAFFKFCYVDITKETDVQKLFENYRNSMNQLSARYPKVKFVHVTTPLTLIKKKTLLISIKEFIGKKIPLGYESNLKRNQFNELMRKEYGPEGKVFDLALFESTLPDNTRMKVEKDDQIYYSLCPDYTDDGGHLNERGRKKVAENLLLLLVNL